MRKEASFTIAVDETAIDWSITKIRIYLPISIVNKGKYGLNPCVYRVQIPGLEEYKRRRVGTLNREYRRFRQSEAKFTFLFHWSAHLFNPLFYSIVSNPHKNKFELIFYWIHGRYQNHALLIFFLCYRIIVIITNFKKSLSL